MKQLLIVTIILFSLQVYSQSEGEKLFNQSCIACHSIGQGKLVGPDLKGVESRHSTSWLKSFITSSQSMIKKGDSSAVNLFKQNNGMIMPDHKLSGKEIESLLAYIKEKGSAIQPEVTAVSVIVKAPTTDNNVNVEKPGNSILKIFSAVPWGAILIIVLLLVVIYVMADVIRALNKLIMPKKE